MKFKAEYYHDKERGRWFVMLTCTRRNMHGGITSQMAQVECANEQHMFAVYHAYLNEGDREIE